MIIGNSLERCARNYPDKTAIKDEYGKYFPAGFSYTYKELNQAAKRLANSFLKLGLRHGDRVAVQTGTGIGHYLSLFALMKAGMAIAPIDRSFMPEEIAYQLEDGGARGFIVDLDIYKEKIEPVRSRCKALEYCITIGGKHPSGYSFETLTAEGAPDQPDIDVREDDIATLIYTSGTTGRPKGAPLTHRNWSSSAIVWAAELGIHPYTRWLLIMPMHTSGGTGLSIVSATAGCSLTVTDPNPEKVLGIIDREKITFTQFSPTLLAKVIRHPAAKNTDFSHIEHWFTSAAPISAELLKEGAQLLGKKFIQLYGTTETALLGTVLRPQEVELEGEKSKRLTSIGRTCIGYETKVVDDKDREVGPGGTGELAVRGDAVARGYWNKPQAADFRDGWWYSGDVVRVDEDGFYYVVDRKKDMIVTGGLNVYPAEVEYVLAAHPAVNIVCVIGAPDEKWGEAVKAVVVLKDGAEATEQELIDFCRDRIAAYKKPKSIDFIDFSNMPMSGGGYKILRRELRDRYRNCSVLKKNGAVWGAV